MESNDTWRAFLATQTLDELHAMRDDFLDVLIATASFLMNSEKRIGKKRNMRRTLVDLVAEKHGG